MFVTAVRIVVEPLFALLCVLRPVGACRGMRRQRLSEQASMQASYCRAQQECSEPQGVTYHFKDTLIKIQAEAMGPGGRPWKEEDEAVLCFFSMQELGPLATGTVDPGADSRDVLVSWRSMRSCFAYGPTACGTGCIPCQENMTQSQGA